MIARYSAFFLASIVYASPILDVRAVTSLNQEAFEEAQKRDNDPTRAFSNTEIKTSDGKCLFVDELSGDFRANLNPIQVAACDGSTGQKWDVITKGLHNDQAGTMLVVNTLTQACMNFDPRRAAGNQVIMFSCGGRADGGGAVTNSQLFPFTGGAGPLAFSPISEKGTCLTVTAGNVLDQAACNTGDASQSFTFGGASAAPPAPGTTAAIETSSVVDTPPASSQVTIEPATSAATSKEVLAPTSTPACVSTTVVTVTRFIDTTSAAVPAETLIVSSESSPAIIVTAAPQNNAAAANPTTPVPVSGAGGTLNPSAAAEANQFDKDATRALTGVSLKSSSGKCLFIDPLAGDFRQNIIPIAVQDCTGSANEKFDFVTSSKHNNVAGATLIVSSLMNGCVSFDPRRAVNKAHVFSCGGRADGLGDTANSQLFPFVAGDTSITIAPENDQGKTCLVDVGGLLTPSTCSGAAGETFTIV